MRYDIELMVYSDSRELEKGIVVTMLFNSLWLYIVK
jgi:hypothetical protein